MQSLIALIGQIKSYAQHILLDRLRLNQIESKMALGGAIASGPPIILDLHIPFDSWLVVAGLKLMGIGLAGLFSGYCTQKGKQWAIKHPDVWIVRVLSKIFTNGKKKTKKDDEATENKKSA